MQIFAASIGFVSIVDAVQVRYTYGVDSQDSSQQANANEEVERESAAEKELRLLVAPDLEDTKHTTFEKHALDPVEGNLPENNHNLYPPFFITRESCPVEHIDKLSNGILTHEEIIRASGRSNSKLGFDFETWKSSEPEDELKNFKKLVDSAAYHMRPDNEMWTDLQPIIQDLQDVLHDYQESQSRKEEDGEPHEVGGDEQTIFDSARNQKPFHTDNNANLAERVQHDFHKIFSTWKMDESLSTWSRRKLPAKKPDVNDEIWPTVVQPNLQKPIENDPFPEFEKCSSAAKETSASLPWYQKGIHIK